MGDPANGGMTAWFIVFPSCRFVYLSIGSGVDTRARAVNPLSIDRATKEVLHWPRQSTEVRSARPNRSSDQGRERRRRSHGIVVGAFKRQEDRQSLIVFDARAAYLSRDSLK